MKVVSPKRRHAKKVSMRRLGSNSIGKPTIMSDVVRAGVISVISLSKVCDASFSITKHAIPAQIKMAH